MDQNNLNYPLSTEYEYITRLVRLDLDQESYNDIANGNGHLISSHKGIKKDLKDPFSIYSPKFGFSLKDIDPLGVTWRCECGRLKYRVNKGQVCSHCKTPVTHMEDNFSYYGWIRLDSQYIINPGLYKSISFFIGKDLENIIAYNETEDEDGQKRQDIIKPKSEPFKDIGMIEFKERFVEIMNYYLTKNPNKKDYYDDIMENIDKVFIQNIPVFTELLRPYLEDKRNFSYEDSNTMYTMINKLKTEINNDSIKMHKQKKPVAQLLYDIQMEYNKLYAYLEGVISGKKGTVRSLVGGRCNFTSRSVIISNPQLMVDQVILPYASLVILLEQQIINIITKLYNYTYDQAYSMWYNASVNTKQDPNIKMIIKSIIDAYKSKGYPGIPIIINRNPTIAFGGILQMYCVDINDAYVMAIPLPILPLLAADFDGDALNILLIINDGFHEMAAEVFNPRNNMYISKNDGMFNMQLSHQRDALINTCSLILEGRDNYTQEELMEIQSILDDNKRITEVIRC